MPKTQSKETVRKKPLTMYVITKSNWGGAQKYVYDMATHDKSDGREVLVVAGGNGELFEKLHEAKIRTLSVKNLGRNISFLKEFSVMKDLLSIYRTFKPEIIHLNSSKIGGLGSLAARIHNLFSKVKSKIIFTAHGWAFNEDRNCLSRLLIFVSSYLTVILSHKTVVLSRYEYNQMAKYPFVKKKLSIEPLSIGAIYFQTKDDARVFLDSKTNSNESLVDKKWIGTIAELHKNKGLEYGIEAIAEIKKVAPQILDDLIWVIIGSGEEEARLAEQIRRKRLEKNIFLVGQIPEASQFLKAFDIFMLPSIKEGLPYVLLEAEKAGLPIIATRVGGIPEFFSKHGNHIVQTKDISALKQAIVGML